ncbi:MAG: IS110 family transposase [Alphaproteobacteria bacterium]|nr:IS110 family transposase [Alphaproteobacteria bacterium]
MEVLYPHCAGLDVHKDTVVACVRHMANGLVRREVRTFKTTTKDLLALSDWLAGEGCTQVAMEATGIYWKPVWHVLSDGDFTLVLANAAHVKNVPGRKTDVNDATWLADLLAHGLIRASFVPDPPTQEMRGLLRTRKQLVRERGRHTQRLQKTLEDANIKLDSVISDIIGLSGRRMIEALIAGETDPGALAALADRRVKATPAELEAALRGRITRHHRFLLRLHLKQIDAIDAAIGDIDQEVDAQIEPFRTAIQLLTTIPGVDALSACVILAEIGRDMSRFPTAGHLISWAGLCPKNDESAGKRRSNRMRKGAPWLKTTLVQCARAAARKKASYLQAQFHRLRARRGARKATGALAASILTIVYHMLTSGELYHDLGPDHFDHRAKAAQTQRLVARLQNLGYAVQIAPLAA